MNFSSLALPAALILTVVFASMIRKLFSRRAWDEGEAEWLDGFSVESYAPMQRLLKESDYTFLAQQSGYTPQISARLRRERRQIFRGYLSQLSADFSRLLTIGQFIVVHSPDDRSELGRTLDRLRFQFYWNWLCAQVYITFYPLPIGAAHAGKLVGALESMQTSLQSGATQS